MTSLPSTIMVRPKNLSFSLMSQLFISRNCRPTVRRSGEHLYLPLHLKTEPGCQRRGLWLLRKLAACSSVCDGGFSTWLLEKAKVPAMNSIRPTIALQPKHVEHTDGWALGARRRRWR